MDNLAHILSLKVMRVSRPALSAAWEPFYSSSPSFSAHSTAAIISLQGANPLPGHPKTLRDLSQAIDILTLPSAFGAIQLGETFSSCLCVNNETAFDVTSVTLRVEMQTVNSKVVLAELGGPDYILPPGETLEHVVHHEIKELGQHVLACTVSYRSPPHMRHTLSAGRDPNDPALQSFRKFYKFAVTNPLSVKTKVHTPKSPTALFAPPEREKVFLEVHIQNTTQEAMWFERIKFECAEGWTAVDLNSVEESRETKDGLFPPISIPMQPQNVRQHIYMLSPSSISSFPITQPPGSVVPLGRLDISWRSSFGEPGRLVTSMISRRIPVPQPPVAQQPASAVPSYLYRNDAGGSPARPGSPQVYSSHPGTPSTPSFRPGSPFRSRAGPGSPRPQSPDVMSIASTTAAAMSDHAPSTGRTPSDLKVDVVVQDIPRESIRVQKPFNIKFKLTVSGQVPMAASDGIQQDRLVRLVVQHLKPPLVSGRTETQDPETTSSRYSSWGFTSPSTSPKRNTLAIFTDKHVVSPRRHSVNEVPLLPAPYFESLEEGKILKLQGFTHLSSSATFLDMIRLSSNSPRDGGPSGDGDTTMDFQVAEATTEFELSYLPLQKGFMTIGGLRVLVVGDQLSEVGQIFEEDSRSKDDSMHIDPRTLREFDLVAEVWVHS